MINTKSLITIAVAISAFLFVIRTSEAVEGGSNYSVFGIGDVFDSPFAAYQGMGGTALAVSSEHAINLANPALWSKVRSSRLQAGYRANQHVVNQGDYQLLQTNSTVDGICGIFSVDTTRGFTLSYGFFPYSVVNYAVRRDFTAKVDDIEVNGYDLYDGKGGVTATYIGGAIKVYDDLFFGTYFFALFGSINSNVDTYFLGDSYYNATNNRNESFGGLGNRSGLYYEGLGSIAVGAFVETNFGTQVERKSVFISSLAEQDTVASSTINLDVPPAFGVGASARVGEFLWAADFKYQNFSGFGFNQGPETVYGDYIKIALGGAKIGTKKSLSKVWEKTTYKFGAGYKKQYYEIKGQNINEFYGTFGMSVPVVDQAFVDFAIIGGTRGTLSEDLLQEYYFRMNIDLSVGETWFKPFRKR